MYNEVLLNIGSIVELHEKEIPECYLIIGRRIVERGKVKAYDYYAVPFPKGIEKNDQGVDYNGKYFNHNQIKKIVYNCKLKINKGFVREDVEKTRTLLAALANEFKI